MMMMKNEKEIFTPRQHNNLNDFDALDCDLMMFRM